MGRGRERGRHRASGAGHRLETLGGGTRAEVARATNRVHETKRGRVREKVVLGRGRQGRRERGAEAKAIEAVWVVLVQVEGSGSGSARPILGPTCGVKTSTDTRKEARKEATTDETTLGGSKGSGATHGPPTNVWTTLSSTGRRGTLIFLARIRVLEGRRGRRGRRGKRFDACAPNHSRPSVPPPRCLQRGTPCAHRKGNG